MIAALTNLFNDRQDAIRGKVFAVYVLLFLVNAAAWLWAIVAFHNYPVLLGTAALRLQLWACGTRSTPITSRRSTMSPAN